MGDDVSGRRGSAGVVGRAALVGRLTVGVRGRVFLWDPLSFFR